MKGITSPSIPIIAAFVALWLTTSLLYAHHSQWRKLGELHEGRYYFGAAYIGNGEVLVAGGLVKKDTNGDNSIKNTVTTKSCEIINIWNRAVSTTASMASARAEFPMLLTQDSNVVVIGGVATNDVSNINANKNLSTVEMYNRSTKEWQVLGSLLIARRQHAAIFINEEEILVVAGRMDNLDGTRSAEIFNIRSGVSRRVADYPYPLNNLNILRTSSGKIIAFGGREGGPTSERYNEVYEYLPQYNVWLRISLMYAGVYGASTTRLWDGRIIISGGALEETPSNIHSLNDTWMEQKDSLFHRSFMLSKRFNHQSIQLTPSSLLFIGGYDTLHSILSSTELLDVTTGKCNSFVSLLEPHIYMSCLSVPLLSNAQGTLQSKNIGLCIGGISHVAFNERGAFDTIIISKTIEVLEIPDCKEESLFSDFTNGNLYGSAQIGLSPTARDTVLVLSPNMPSTSAAFFSRERAPLYDGFRASFSFMIENGSDNNVPDSSFPGGDGLAFVIHNSRTPIDISNAPGRGLGYTGIPNSLAVEFDMYRNTNFKDPDGNHIAVQCHGRKNNSAKHSKESTLGYSSDIPLFKSDVIYYASVLYKDHRIEVYLETQPITQSTTPRLVVENMDLESLLDLDQGSAYVGFTASTGSASQKQTLLQWNFAPCYIDWNAPKE